MKGQDIKLYKKIKWSKSAQKTGALLMRFIVMNIVLPKQIGEVCNFKFRFRNYKYVDQTHHFGFNELNKIHDVLKKKFISGISRRFVLECQARGDDLIRFSQKIAKIDLSRLSSLEILKIFRKFVEKYGKSWAFVFDGYWSIEVLTNELMLQLSKISKNVDNDFINLATLTQETHITERQKKLLKIAGDIYRNKDLRQVFFKEKIEEIKKAMPTFLKQKIEKVYEQYKWMGTQFLLGKMLKIDDFIEEVKFMVEKNPLATFKKLDSERAQTIKKFDETVKRLRIKGRLLQIVNELKKASFQRTEELKYSITGEYYFILFLEEVAKRLGLTYGQVIYMTNEEIEKYLKLGKRVSQPFKKIISSRRKEYALLLLNGRKYVLAGKEIDPIRDKLEFDVNAKEIKGDIASGGKASGTARVILNTDELDRVKKGDILVTLMTTPDYIMAMNRSAAVVTNDGGITCHAAIISRELGIPCIVGTKFATRVLKDGDLVEVDARKGIVKILKRK